MWRYGDGMRSNLSHLFLLAAVGCTSSGKVEGPESAADNPIEGPESIPGQEDSDSGDSADPGDSGDSGWEFPPDLDCAALPDAPLSKGQAEGARGYHGLVFDDDGRMLGWDGRSALVGARSDGSSEVVVPGIESAEQMVRMEDGRIFVVNQWEFGVDVISPSGSRSAFVRGINGAWPYGLVLGPDGKLYVVDGSIYRLDPDTAELEHLWGTGDEWFMPHTVGFSLDSRTMYIAMVSDGWMYSVELDDNLDFLGEPERFAYLDGGWQDTAVVDVCGNIYVADFYTSRIYRVSSEGEAEVFYQARPEGYPHGFAWGTGKDGWDDQTLYAPLPYAGNSVATFEVGVPDGRLVREWNGVRVGR
jgi:hypothetical protein